MPSFPVLLEHAVACGVEPSGRPMRTSILDAAATVLVCRGADSIIVPVPDGETREQVLAGIEGMPERRQTLVRLVDSSGAVLDGVRSFLEPISAYATKWPEDAFVGFAETFLYHVALATAHKAGIASDAVHMMREFVPLIDTRLFKGESRYRLAELVRITAMYEPIEIPHGVILPPIDRATAFGVDEILDSAEFQRVVAASGLIGLVRRPKLVVSQLRRRFCALVSKPQVTTTMGLASAVGDIGVLSGVGTVVSVINRLVPNDMSSRFSPPFVPLGSAELGIYRMALTAHEPKAVSPPGEIMVFEYTRAGHTGGLWLSVGEESKLSDEEKTAYESHLAASVRVREVQSRFF